MKKNHSSRSRVAASHSFTEGEIAVLKSMVANDVKTPLNSSKGKQKTIGPKKNPSFYRKEK